MKKIQKKSNFNFLKFLIAPLLLSGAYGLYSTSSSTNLTSVNPNEVPYLSTYYIKPVVSTTEDVIIDFYVTDYNHTEYVEETFDYTFTITVKVEGKDDIILKDVKGGDHSVNLGKFANPGEQKFSILATDQYGRNSHELFNFFLVKKTEILKPKCQCKFSCNYNPPEDYIAGETYSGKCECDYVCKCEPFIENLNLTKEYIMKESDLVKYNIKNTDNYEVKNIQTLKLINPTPTTVKSALEEVSKNITPSSNTYTCIIADTKGTGEPGQWWGETIVKYAPDYNKDAVMKESQNTRLGLQKFLDDKKSEGFNKVTLLKGVYRIDHLEPIYIPTQFTLDMNGATFKQNQFASNKALMIELNNTFDSHIINGIIEGDYYSHDYVNSPNNSEWVNGISIGGESKYSSFENLIVKDITGYGGTNGIADSRDKKLGYTYIYPKGIGNSFTLGDINRNTGEIINSDNRTTSNFIDISGYSDIGYLSISRYLGYQGNPCSTWNLIAHFYDENKNFIKSVDGYQYRRIGIPKNAKFMKVTILSTDKPTDLSVQLFRVPTHCLFKNIKFENCRSVGLAPAAMKDMLVENCEFTKSGQTLTRCAFDAEDGWDLMQDVTFKGLNFYNNPNNEFLTAAGHNFIIEAMKGGKVYFYPRTNSYIVKNSNNLITAGLGHSDRRGSGYVRIINNEINSSIILGYSNENDTWKLIVKDCKINGKAENKLNTGIFIRCDIGKSVETNTPYLTALAPGNFKDCYIHDKFGENVGGVYEDCKLENIKGNMNGDFKVLNSKVVNLDCYSGNYNPTYIFKNCTLENFKIQFATWYPGPSILLENCIINTRDYIFKINHNFMNKDIILRNNKITSESSIGIINFYYGDINQLVPKNRLILESNSIYLSNSKYVLTGFSGRKIESSNIISTNNMLYPNSINILDNN